MFLKSEFISVDKYLEIILLKHLFTRKTHKYLKGILPFGLFFVLPAF